MSLTRQDRRSLRVVLDLAEDDIGQYNDSVRADFAAHIVRARKALRKLPQMERDASAYRAALKAKRRL